MYSLLCSAIGQDLITGSKISGADRWLGVLGGLGKIGAVGKMANLAKNINKVVSYTQAIRNTVIAATGDDPLIAGDQNINGASRLVAGLNSPIGGNLPVIGKLNEKQLQYLTSGYQLGTAITGKEGLFFGGKLTEDERWSLGVSGTSFFAYQGLKYGYNYLENVSLNQLYDAYKKGGLDQNKIDNMNLEELLGLKSKVKNDNLTDDKKLDKIIDSEIDEKLSNIDLTKSIIAFERQQKLTGKEDKMLELLKQERNERIDSAKQFLMNGNNSVSSQQPMGQSTVGYKNRGEALKDLISLGEAKIVNTNGVMRVEIQTPGLSTTTCVIEWDPKQGLSDKVKLNIVNGVTSMIDTSFTLADFSKILTSSGNSNLMAMADIMKWSLNLVASPSNLGDYVPIRDVLEKQAKEYLKKN